MFERGTRRLAAVMAASAGVIVNAIASNAGAAQASSNSQAPLTLLHAALNDATRKGSVHESEHGAGQIVITGDIGLHDGHQTATFPTPAGARLQVIAIGTTAYVSTTNSTLLVEDCGFSNAAARKAGSRWVSVPSSSSSYALIVPDVTLPSALATLSPTGHLTVSAPSVFHGQHVVGVRGKASSAAAPFTSETLYISQASTSLPVYAAFSGPKGLTETDVLSRWGEHLTVAAPANAVSLASLS